MSVVICFFVEHISTMNYKELQILCVIAGPVYICRAMARRPASLSRELRELVSLQTSRESSAIDRVTILKSSIEAR